MHQQLLLSLYIHIHCFLIHNNLNYNNQNFNFQIRIKILIEKKEKSKFGGKLKSGGWYFQLGVQYLKDPLSPGRCIYCKVQQCWFNKFIHHRNGSLSAIEYAVWCLQFSQSVYFYPPEEYPWSAVLNATALASTFHIFTVLFRCNGVFYILFAFEQTFTSQLV